MIELLFELLWSKTLSAPSFGRYWKQPIGSPYYLTNSLCINKIISSVSNVLVGFAYWKFFGIGMSNRAAGNWKERQKSDFLAFSFVILAFVQISSIVENFFLLIFWQFLTRPSKAPLPPKHTLAYIDLNHMSFVHFLPDMFIFAWKSRAFISKNWAGL